jgi:MFS family permease
MAASLLLGLGTAMVYPTLIAAISDVAHPNSRARALSVYRFWRDLGYAVGAIGDIFGRVAAIAAIGALTFLSGFLVALVMPRR